jgi:hypothetical protein
MIRPIGVYHAYGVILKGIFEHEADTGCSRESGGMTVSPAPFQRPGASGVSGRRRVEYCSRCS